MGLVKSLFPQVYVDLDDVLGETMRAFLEVLRGSFNKTIQFEDVLSFDLGESFGLGRKDLAEFMVLAHKPSVLMSIQPIDGAAEVLQDWKKRGKYIAVITGRPISTLNVSREWLRINRIPHDSLSVIDKYGHSKGHKVLGLRTVLKSDFCFAVEDSTRMAKFLAHNAAFPIVLLDRPWNKRVERLSQERAGLIMRCHDWQEIADTVSRSGLS